MKKVILTLATASALALVTTGMAASGNAMDSSYSDNSNSSAAGLFVSGDLGRSTISDSTKNTDNNTTVTQKEGGSFAWAINAGYQFNKYLAAELGYISFLDASSSTSGTNGGSTSSSLGGFDFNAKGIIPVTDKFSVFAKGGMIDMQESIRVTDNATATILTSKDSVWTPDFGGGVSYNLAHNVALNAQVIHAFQKNFTKKGVKVSMPGATAYLAGVTYKFNV